MEPAFAPALALRSTIRIRFQPCRSSRSLFIRRHIRSSRRAVACASPPALKGQKLVITTPLFYVNAAPHMGSAYPTLAADALARFYRMAGASASFVTGTDEHGEKIAAAAAAAAARGELRSTQAFCDEVAGQFKELWSRMDVNYDRFVRTTSEHHQLVVRQFMERVWANGDIYKSEYEGLYCTGCEEYKDLKDLLPRNMCPIHQTTCFNRKEDNYFFALSKYQDSLEIFLEDNPSFVQPLERRNEVLGWVKSGIRDFSVSRANNPWGIPVPRDDNQTIYVWFDALVGYLSALLQDTDEPSLEKLASRGWPADVHIIGKDILRFHAVYWPAMLMSAGLPLPRRVIGHGFITKDGMKMGKSLGNTLDPCQLVDSYGSDAVRYYFLKALDFGKDGDFSEQRFVDIVNADLANSLGNLLNRSLNLLKRNCSSSVPISSSQLGLPDADDDEKILRQTAEHAYKEAYAQYEALNFNAACEALMSISFEANAYIDRVAPWTKFKSQDAEDIRLAQRCIVNVLEASRIVAVGLNPIVPQFSRKVYNAFGLVDEYERGLTWEQMRWGRLTEGMAFAKPKPVFPRLELVAQQAAVVS
ncbi:Methionine--tRNA ligase [Gracilaria domingensis]|nr:Methionine--tRNA ligase [Gracilaria domingensis]